MLAEMKAPAFCSSLHNSERGSAAVFGLSLPKRSTDLLSCSCNKTVSLGMRYGREHIRRRCKAGPQCLLHKCLMAKMGPESGPWDFRVPASSAPVSQLAQTLALLSGIAKFSHVIHMGMGGFPQGPLL